MHRSSLKILRNSVFLTIAIACSSLGFIQVISENPNFGSSLLTFMQNHKFYLFMFRTVIAIALFFVWPILVSNQKGTHSIDNYNKLINFRWAILVIFFLLETIKLLG